MGGGIAILLLVIVVIAAGVATIFGGGIGVLRGARQNVASDAEFVSSEREGER